MFRPKGVTRFAVLDTLCRTLLVFTRSNDECEGLVRLFSDTGVFELRRAKRGWDMLLSFKVPLCCNSGALAPRRAIALDFAGWDKSRCRSVGPNRNACLNPELKCQLNLKWMLSLQSKRSRDHACVRGSVAEGKYATSSRLFPRRDTGDPRAS